MIGLNDNSGIDYAGSYRSSLRNLNAQHSTLGVGREKIPLL